MAEKQKGQEKGEEVEEVEEDRKGKGRQKG